MGMPEARILVSSTVCFSSETLGAEGGGKGGGGGRRGAEGS